MNARTLVLVAVAASVVLLGPGITTNWAAAYTALDLAPVGCPYLTQGVGFDKVLVSGEWQTARVNKGSNDYAIRWNGSGGTLAELTDHATFSGSEPAGMDGTHVVGYGMGIATNSNVYHALVWDVTDTSFVDLHPSGWYESRAQGIRGNQVVGYGQGASTNWQWHALAWNITTGTRIDLHPLSGYDATQANATDGQHQVGNGLPTGGAWPYYQHALLWNGTNIATDLHPAGYTQSYALGVDGDLEVGYGLAAGSVFNHALLWRGSATDYSDLNPKGWDLSEAVAISGDRAVGFGRNPSGLNQALVWNTTDLSYMNLQQFLPANFNQSWATSIDASGNIAGYAQDSVSNVWHPILWQVTAPEPGTLAVLALGGLALLKRRTAKG